MRGTVDDGFSLAELPSDFAADLESRHRRGDGERHDGDGMADRQSLPRRFTSVDLGAGDRLPDDAETFTQGLEAA